MLKPDVCLTSILEIDINILKKMEVIAIILDVDNTIRFPKKGKLLEGVLYWVKNLKRFGFKIIIASNNFRKNIEPIANFLNLPFISFSFKPFPFGLKKAAKKLNVSKKQVVVVGDQLFTDVIGGKIQGFKTILVDPLKFEKGFFWKVRRKLEKIILNRIL